MDLGLNMHYSAVSTHCNPLDVLHSAMTAFATPKLLKQNLRRSSGRPTQLDMMQLASCC